jgi:phenylalanine-4-hydroxylase
MKGELTIQNYKSYSKGDHETWSKLFERQVNHLKIDNKVVDEFWEGISKLKIKKGEIPNFENVNKLLKPINNFEIIAVTGIIDDGIFFQLLKNRKFPVTTWIRKPEEIDYIEQPDIFHDLFGHVPFLVNKTYSDLLVKLAEHAVAAFQSNDKELQYQYSRFYWYTIEFGLLLNENRYQIYGAGIISSYSESNKALANDSLKKNFDNDLLSIKFEKDHLQDFYAVVEGQLENALTSTLIKLPLINETNTTPAEVN